MRRLSLLSLLLFAAGCPRQGGKAEPARVEIEWPDAAPTRAPAPLTSAVDGSPAGADAR